MALTVQQLINRLNKMPRRMHVGIAHHDNDDGEIAGYVLSVDLIEEIDIETREPIGKCVRLQC